MTGRVWQGKHPKGNEYNKHNKERGEWLPEILNMTGWKIVFLFRISTSLHEKGKNMFPQFYMISRLLLPEL
jgi:hypothetical protein